MAISFLESVAKAYTSREQDLSGYLFIFPNRRACTFFLKNITQQYKDKTKILPSVTTMSEFIEKVSGKVVAGKIETLFVMYEAYIDILKKEGETKIPEFDAFRKWGETALSDYNEVDMQDADPDAIFKNVKDIREISSNFLTDEQLKIMEEFFGQSYDPELMAKGFWQTFTEQEDHELNSKFRLLWQVLAPVYHSLSEALEQKGMITSGGAYRKAAKIFEKGIPDCVSAKKIVVVGFNALTHSERRIFDALSTYRTDDNTEPYVDFLWDATGPVINDPSSAAGRFVQFNRKRWPSPEWTLRFLFESESDKMPESIKVIAVPSNSLQTKVVGEELEKMEKELDPMAFKEAKVAVVLPDESLLIPMLYSLPENIKEVNLTMGYPLRLSGIANFITLLRRLQASRRKKGNGVSYYYKDLNTILSHPFSQVLFVKDTAKAKDWIIHTHHALVDIHELRNISPLMAEIFSPLRDDAGIKEVAEWLDNILVKIVECIKNDINVIIKANVDIANIEYYRLSIRQLLSLAEEYKIEMSWNTFLSLTDRLISSETVIFEGQPLKGLQVMGLLETRALDFERIIIPSLNERILPAKRRSRTFISESLRKAYGLPPVNYSESIFAYYFYRMISRAKEVVMIYDSRSSEGARSGDVSRYVLQLKYLYASGLLNSESRTFEMSQSDLKPHPVKKTESIISQLKLYSDNSSESRNLSATALTKYASCQIRFYFEHILNIKTDETSVDFIDAITQGSVLHYAMQNIYLPKEKQGHYLQHPEIIDATLVASRLEDTDYIYTLIRRAINKMHFHRPDSDIDMPLTGSADFVAKAIQSQVVGILEFDLRQTPFLLFGVEIEGNVKIELPGNNPINMRFAIDRLDGLQSDREGNCRPTLRIVDYKTGSVHAVSDSISEVFEGDYSGKNLLQLWLYANLFDALPDKRLQDDSKTPLLKIFDSNSGLPKQPFVLELYDVSAMKKGVHTYPKVGGEIIKTHSELNEEFLFHLEKMLRQLFDPTVPFMPPTDLDTCKFCPFKSICWR